MRQQTINSLLNQRKQLYIPSYQRRYSWKQENVERFLNDMMGVIDKLINKENVEKGHYIGTIYLQEKDNGVWELIDGQQRLTTVTLLAYAVVDMVVSSNPHDIYNKRKWTDQYIIDDDSVEYKLQLGYDDELNFKEIRDKGDVSVVLRDNRTHKVSIRRLTSLECWRLMGIKDEDFHKAQEVCSNTQLQKQAGNAIVVQVLEALFSQLNLVTE